VIDHAPGSARAGVRTAGALFLFWFTRDYLVECQRWLEQTLAADHEQGQAGSGPEIGARARTGGHEIVQTATRMGMLGADPRIAALNALNTLIQQQKVEGGTARAEETLALARGAEDRLGVAHALATLCMIAHKLGQHEQAARMSEEGLSIFRSLDDQFGLWRSLNHFGTACTELGQIERGCSWLEESLAVARSMGHPWGVAHCVRMLGLAAYLRGDLDRAAAYLEESLAWWRQARATRGPAWSLFELGQVVLASGNPARAVAYFAESLTLCRDGGDRSDAAQCLVGMAAGALATSDRDPGISATDTARLLGKAAAMRETLGNPVRRSEQPIVERARAAAHSSLDEETYTVALAEGRDMPLDRAIELALGLGRQIQAAASVAAQQPAQNATHGSVL